MRGEECADEQHVDGESGRAAHKGVDEYGDESARTAFDGACGHYGGYGAAKSHYERYE